MRVEIFSSAFWGILLIIIGLLLVIKYIFNIHLPIGRIVLALLFIYLGVRLLMGHQGGNHYNFTNTANSAVFSEQTFNYSPSLNTYSCAFGSCMLNLTDINLTENKVIDVSVVFGEFRVKVKKDANLKIHSSTAFGSTLAPDNSSYGFGQRIYNSPGFNKELPYLTIKTNVAFGSIKILYY